jgi:uncharacterized OB-fold protein
MTESASAVAGLARSAASQPFWDGLAAGELRLPYCRRCEEMFFYPRPFCPRCWSEDIVWRPAAGSGTVYAVTTVHVAFDPTLPVPYAVALVDLDEGVRLPGRVEPNDAGVAVGDRVQLTFGADPAGTLPIFRPAPAG